MKYYLLSFACMLLLAPAVAQEPIETYCKLSVTTLTNRKNENKISVDFGSEIDSLYLKQHNFLQDLEKVSSLKNDVEALNFLAKKGWRLISVVVYRDNDFKKEQLKEFYLRKAIDEK